MPEGIDRRRPARHGAASWRFDVRRYGDVRVIGSLAGLIAAALLIVAAAVYAGSLSQDAVQRQAEERIVAQSIEGLKRSLGTTVLDYAWWDEAVRALVLTSDADWADKNLGGYIQRTYHYEVSLVVAGDGRPVFGWFDGLRGGEEAAVMLGPALPALLARIRKQDGPEPQPATAILAGPAGLFAAAASRIVPQSGSKLVLPDEPPTLLVFARRLDAGFLAEIAGDFGLHSLSFAPPGAVVSGFAHADLRGPSGEVVRRIVWEPWHPGRAQLAWFIPALLGALLVFLGFTQLVLESVRRSTAAIRASEARFRDIAEAASDWIWETDARFCLTYVSEHFGRATGLGPAEVVGRPLHEFLELPSDFDPSPDAAATAGRSFRDVLCRLRSDGYETRTLRVAGKPVHAADGTLLGYRGTATDITAEMRALEQVRFLAKHDALTGLPNRLVLRDRLAEALRRCGRYGEVAAIMYLDLDRFKEVNDSLGHAAGDMLLVACADRLKACVRKTDLVARIGGDEFAVLQTDVRRPVDVRRLCERMLASLTEPFLLDGSEVVIGASIGVALIPADGEDAMRLMQNADIALYRAKDGGRNRFCFFEAGMDEQLRQRKVLEAALRHALAAGQLEVHYQPLLEASSTRITGVEALLRWRHPEHGAVPPAEFIPLAEETGLIAAIGEWVLHHACRNAVRWSGLKVSVNVSPAQFRHRDLVETVAKALAASGLEPERLEIEITEGVLVQNAAEALTTLKRLKALGIRIAMDDFGTGYSSLSYLQRFPFDKIKIDKSFVAGLRAESGAIVRAIVGLSRSLGMQTCAEGVETVEQLDLLRREGCEQVQGYLFGRAMTASAIDALLHGNLQPIGAGQLRQYLLESPPRGKATPQDGADQGEQAHSL